MGVHDIYGKQVLRTAFGPAFQDSGAAVRIPYGSRGGATVDGVVGTEVAVEIDSRVSKQVRGAVMDLVCHPFPKKLLVLLPVHMSSSKLCAEQCESILGRFLQPEQFRVVVFRGTGHAPSIEDDVRTVRAVVAELSESR
jgi:hypothetical protein